VAGKDNAKLTINDLLAMKTGGKPIVCLTAYDFASASIVDDAGVDLILVGDSLGMVVQGHDNTLKVTLDQIIYHTEIVARAAKRAFVVADMPFMSFQVSRKKTVENVGRVIKESGAQAVKFEGAAEETLKSIRSLTAAGIPVMGHVGYTPQSTHAFGRNIVQGKTTDRARVLMTEARNLQDAGCFSVVLEMVPRELAGFITGKLTVPTIGIGSGPDCDGQILVFHDLIGYYTGYIPKFVRRLLDVKEAIGDAVTEYAKLVRGGEYPSKEESVSLPEAVIEEIRGSGNSD
jgi:3-methyl-2-oxobutanoate hydroxymethyltransferase